MIHAQLVSAFLMFIESGKEPVILWRAMNSDDRALAEKYTRTNIISYHRLESTKIRDLLGCNEKLGD